MPNMGIVVAGHMNYTCHRNLLARMRKARREQDKEEGDSRHETAAVHEVKSFASVVGRLRG